MNDGFWGKEEFEDLVARSLIAMYENKIFKECKAVPPFIRPSDKDISQLREFGSYFAPSDRIMVMGNEIDVINDGFQKEASWAMRPQFKEDEEMPSNEYFRLGHLKLLGQAPPGILNHKKLKYFGDHKIYKLIYFSTTECNRIHIQKSYVTIDPKGLIYDTYARKQNGEAIILAAGTMGREEKIQSDVGWAAGIFGFYSDRKYLWNVTAKEHSAKATFGVYPEQIKSLFYAREMPMTETGRKRPILHWVAAHNRRIKNGIDVDIEKHLRGINEFVFQGTKFEITRPIKGKNNE